ncbi:MAG: hypothetical protein AB1446_06830 [Bacillota bacterium]
MNIREETLSHTALLFDANNPRFQDLEDFVVAREERFHETSVQERAYARLKRDENLISVKHSILRNGYVNVERMVVRPYDFQQEKFVVIEGNRRLAAIRWINEGLPDRR